MGEAGRLVPADWFDEIAEGGVAGGVMPGIAAGVGVGVGLGVGVGHGFSSEVHSCQGADSLPPNSFQSAWQRSDQWL